MDPKNENPWKTLSAEEKYNNPWIKVTEYQVLNPAGKEGIYGKVHFKNKAIGIIPIDEHMNTWLVGQYRYPLGEWSWEIPEGGSPLITDPLESAKRELKEETGLTATRWKQILRIHLSNSVSDEEGFVFIAQDLTQGSCDLEDTEADLTVRKLPLADAIKMTLGGEITDSLSVVGLLKAARDFGL